MGRTSGSKQSEEVMSLKTENTSPAPWSLVFHSMVDPAKPWRIVDANHDTVSFFLCGGDAANIILFANAADVMARRSWQPEKTQSGWRLCHNVIGFMNIDAFTEWWRDAGDYADPFTPLIEADAWFKANVDCKAAS